MSGLACQIMSVGPDRYVTDDGKFSERKPCANDMSGLACQIMSVGPDRYVTDDGKFSERKRL